MNKEVTANRLSDDREISVTVNTASSCPKCGVTLSPDLLYAALIEDVENECNNKLFVLNLCDNCEECFISRHIYDEDTDVYLYESSAPALFFYTAFSENMKKLSPNFISIYNESAHAESLGLHSICGMGYRKALEFLVKDYAIFSYPTDSEKIASLPLAQCISQYIDNKRIKSLATASAWLGNDETHYIKKHPEYGVTKLKAFITAIVTFIDAELACRDAQVLLSH